MNIDKLILKSLNKTASLQEYEALEAWKAESDQNLAFLKQMQNKYQETNYQDFDKESGWNNINSKLEVVQKDFNYNWVLAIITLALIGVAAFFYMSKEKVDTIFSTQENTAHYALMDNSNIWLNHNSEVEYLTDFQNERKVSLTGEAYFEVNANPANPFIITLNSNDFIKVVGTKFNVINRGDNFDLTVYEGKVEFHALNRVIHLEKDERIVKINGSFTKILNQDKNILSWKNKELLFDNVSLKKAFTKIESHYNVDINLDKDINISKCKLRSKYRQENISEVFVELKKFYDLEYTLNGKTIKITKLNCN